VDRGWDCTPSPSAVVRVSSPIGGCGTCDRRWGALGEAHCRYCHAHFGSDYSFDRHLIRNYNKKGWTEHSGIPAVEWLPVACFSEPTGRHDKPRLIQVERTHGCLWVTKLAEGVWGERRTQPEEAA
jgi:hypothetical protein